MTLPKSYSSTLLVKLGIRTLNPFLRRHSSILLLILIIPAFVIPVVFISTNSLTTTVHTPKSKSSTSSSLNTTTTISTINNTNLTQNKQTKGAAFRERIFKPIFYFKTHKTASTTISITLHRYARRHRLSIFTQTGRVYLNYSNNSKKKYDVMALQHMPFSYRLLDTYLKSRPNLVLTSVRYPIPRAISWFRQQNKQIASIPINNCTEQRVSKLISAFDRFTNGKRQQASQFIQLQERSLRIARESRQLTLNETYAQFHFIFLKERLKESFECLCKQVGIRLCDKRRPLKMRNAKHTRRCVEQTLLKHRLERLSSGLEQDLALIKMVENRLDQCQKDGIPSHCKCYEAYK